MIGTYLKVCADLTVETPLHPGTGESGFSLPIKGEDNVPVEVALVQHDHARRPILSGASLKGALRAALTDRKMTALLFGPATIDAETPAHVGRLTIRTAKLDESRTVNPKTAPYANAPLATADGEATPNISHGDVGLFVEARTAVDPERGTAAAGRLFHHQMVAPGNVFRLSMALASPDKTTEAGLFAVLRQLRHGLSLGSGTRHGQGRVRLSADTLKVTAHDLKRDGTLQEKDRSTEWRGKLRQAALSAAPKGQAETLSLRLIGKSPFIVSDGIAMARRQEDRDAKGDSDKPHLDALKGFVADLPRLPGPSLSGALRARALWIGRLSEPLYVDNSDLIYDTRLGSPPSGVRDPKASRLGDPTLLSASERVFGVSGWRGLLRIGRIVCTGHCGWTDLPSVKLDRFSGAPIDQGFFVTRASLDPVFEVDLVLDRRSDWPGAADITLVKNLKTDLIDHGLALGLGENRGFGWFEVEERT